MTLPPELASLIMKMTPAPSEMLEQFRDSENLHEMAHVLIDIADLEESCDDVEERIRQYDDHAFTILLFHLGMLRPTVLPMDASMEVSEEQPKLLN